MCETDIKLVFELFTPFDTF